MDINCSIVEDLYIMYKENELNEETKALIDEHLQKCEKCRNIYQTGNGFRFTSNTHNIPTTKNLDNIIKTKLKYRRLKIISLFTVILLVFMFVSSWYIGFKNNRKVMANNIGLLAKEISYFILLSNYFGLEGVQSDYHFFITEEQMEQDQQNLLRVFYIIDNHSTIEEAQKNVTYNIDKDYEKFAETVISYASQLTDLRNRVYSHTDYIETLTNNLIPLGFSKNEQKSYNEIYNLINKDKDFSIISQKLDFIYEGLELSKFTNYNRNEDIKILKAFLIDYQDFLLDEYQRIDAAARGKIFKDMFKPFDLNKLNELTQDIITYDRTLMLNNDKNLDSEYISQYIINMLTGSWELSRFRFYINGKASELDTDAFYQFNTDKTGHFKSNSLNQDYDFTYEVDKKYLYITNIETSETETLDISQSRSTLRISRKIDNKEYIYTFSRVKLPTW